MEMGGGALHPNLWIRYPSVLPSPSSLFSRSLSNPSLRLRLRLRPAAGELLSAGRPRSSIYSKKEECCTLQKLIHKSKTALQASNSCGPQEAKLNCKEMSKDKFLVDCGTDQECVIGGIVALGKFDALHIGHRELAIQASKAGTPFLLSFIGMAEVLGWESRPPIVAKCDRKRVLSTWASFCGDAIPIEYQVEFSKVRHLTPQQFVEKLSKELRVGGVVAGENYRFGYKASGDTRELVRLCKEYGLDAYIVSPVMDSTQRSSNGSPRQGINSNDRGQVSSTRVRAALAMGDMEYVAQLLGRKHRLVLSTDGECLCTSNRVSVPKSCMLNQPPQDGEFNSCTLLVDDAFLGPCKVAISSESINIELEDESFQLPDLNREGRLIGIEFG